MSFGFAVNTGAPLTNAVTFSLFDAADNLLASVTADADFTLPNGVDPSSFPEALVPLAFAGTAAYGTFDFDTTANRYIIDNFEGTFGTTEVPRSQSPRPSYCLARGWPECSFGGGGPSIGAHISSAKSPMVEKPRVL